MLDSDLRTLEREWLSTRDPALKPGLIAAYARAGRWDEWRALVVEDFEAALAVKLPETWLSGKAIRGSEGRRRKARRAVASVIAAALDPKVDVPHGRRGPRLLEACAWSVTHAMAGIRMVAMAHAGRKHVSFEVKWVGEEAIARRGRAPDAAWKGLFPWRVKQRKTALGTVPTLDDGLVARLRRWARRRPPGRARKDPLRSRKDPLRLRLPRQQAADLAVALLGKAPGARPRRPDWLSVAVAKSSLESAWSRHKREHRSRLRRAKAYLRRELEILRKALAEAKEAKDRREWAEDAGRPWDFRERDYPPGPWRWWRWGEVERDPRWFMAANHAIHREADRIAACPDCDPDPGDCRSCAEW